MQRCSWFLTSKYKEVSLTDISPFILPFPDLPQTDLSKNVYKTLTTRGWNYNIISTFLNRPFLRFSTLTWCCHRHHRQRRRRHSRRRRITPDSRWSGRRPRSRGPRFETCSLFSRPWEQELKWRSHKLLSFYRELRTWKVKVAPTYGYLNVFASIQ